MALKDRIPSLTKSLEEERVREFEHYCEIRAEEIRQAAVSEVEMAIKYKKYNRRLLGKKYVTGNVHPGKIVNRDEEKQFVNCIIAKLKKEGFKCKVKYAAWAWDPSQETVITYKMEWK